MVSFEENFETLFNELQKKAYSGDVSAQYQLAQCFFEGGKIPYDICQAIHWYAYAAQGGNQNAIAQFDRLYYCGRFDGYKIMGFWFERECMLRTYIPASVPYEISPIKCDAEDKTNSRIKVLVPWSEFLRLRYKIDITKLKDVKNRNFIEINIGDEGYTFKLDSADTQCTDSEYNGNKTSLQNNDDIDMSLVYNAVEEGLLKKIDDISIDNIVHHKRFCEAFFEEFAGETLNENVWQKIVTFSILKGMEQGVAADVYGHTKRHSAYDFYALFEDCLLDDDFDIITELPFHLNSAINSYADVANRYAKKTFESGLGRDNIKKSMLTYCLIGDSLAHLHSLAEIKIKNYDNAYQPTMEELRTIAGDALLEKCIADGGKILTYRFARSCNTNAVVEYKNETRAFLLRAAVSASNIKFYQYEINRFYDGAMSHNCIPYIVKAEVTSTNEQHSADGIIVLGDLCEVALKQTILRR